MKTFNNRDWLSACSHLSFSLSHGISWEPQWSGREGRVKGQEVEQGGGELHVEHHHTEGTTGSTLEATTLMQHVIHCLFVFFSCLYYICVPHCNLKHITDMLATHTRHVQGQWLLVFFFLLNGSCCTDSTAVRLCYDGSCQDWEINPFLGQGKQTRLTKGLWDDDRCLLIPIKSWNWLKNMQKGVFED